MAAFAGMSRDLLQILTCMLGSATDAATTPLKKTGQAMRDGKKNNLSRCIAVNSNNERRNKQFD